MRRFDMHPSRATRGSVLTARENHEKPWIMEDPAITLMKRLWDSLTRGDMETYASFFAPDALVHKPGNHPIAGEYKGRAGILSKHDKIAKLMFAGDYNVGDYKGEQDEIAEERNQRAKMTAGTYSAEILHMCTNGQGMLTLTYRESGERNGKRLDQVSAVVCHIRDGQILEMWELAEDLPALDEFWS